MGALYKVDGIGDDELSYRFLTGPARASATKGKYFQGVPLAKLEPDAEDSTTPIENFYDLASSFGNCRHEGGVDFRSGKKPEALLEIVLNISLHRGTLFSTLLAVPVAPGLCGSQNGTPLDHGGG